MKGQLTITFENELNAAMFEGEHRCFAGPMVTVLGTSLQNRDLLKFFHESTWGYWFRNGRLLQKPFNLLQKEKCP
jgi:hypothetical protein